MSSAADMLDVGCPELAPVLERMLSTRNCCASARHCSAPTVPWSICCVTSYLLGGTAITSRTDCISYYPAPVVQKLHAHRATRGLSRPPTGYTQPGLTRSSREKEDSVGRRGEGRGEGRGREGGHEGGHRGERDRPGGDRPGDRGQGAGGERRQERREERQQERQERRQERREERQQERQERRQDRQRDRGPEEPGGGPG